MFADLHVHSTLFSFNRLRNDPDDEADPDRFQPWAAMPCDLEQLKRGARAAAYSQASFPQMTRGRLRLPFISLTPIEKGFLEWEGADGRPSLGQELLELGAGVTPARALWRGIRDGAHGALFELTGALRASSPLRVLLSKGYLHYGLDRLRYLVSPEYDYWEELQREYRFLRSRDGVPGSGAAPGLDTCSAAEQVQGTYHLARSAAEVEQIITENDSELACILSIEGGHVLSIGPGGRVLPVETMLERIQELKGWEHPVLFVGIAHHFDNGLTGHARSLPQAGRLVIDQSRRMHGGLERQDDAGPRVLRELLDLDERCRDRGGKRILVDVKHLSPLARRQYYDEILKPALAEHSRLSRKEQERSPKLPVIGSHVAYAGVESFAKLIGDARNETDQCFRGPYYAWGLNLCDEDVQMTHATDGLLGIILDRRVVGTRPGVELDRAGWAQVFAQQLFGMVDVIFRDGRLTPQEQRTIWDCLCIGSDFDGLVQPLAAYPTVIEYELLAEDLRQLLWQHRDTRQIAAIGVDALVEKIAWRNAYDFCLRHLPRATEG